jgi:hypothetical protein
VPKESYTPVEILMVGKAVSHYRVLEIFGSRGK